MPVREPVVIGGTRGYRLRHIGPQATIWPNPQASIPTFSVLSQSAMISRPIPVSNVPGAPDFQDGQFSTRLGDAGDGQLNFPNSLAADGVPFRDRFDSSGHNQWMEVYSDGYLESIFNILVVNKSQGVIQVTGQDPFFMGKKGFVRDWTVVQSPRDVFERGTMLWVPVLVDNFPSGFVLGSQWQAQQIGGGTVNIGLNGGCVLAVPAAATTSNNSNNGPSTVVDNSGVGTNVWSHPGYAKTKDGVSATAVNSTANSVNTHYLWATNFGFNLPATATVNGIQVKVLRKGSGNLIVDNSVKIIKGGATAGTDHSAAGVFWPGTLTNATYGSNADLWGTTWLFSDINASNFGVAFSATLGQSFGGNVTAYVDYVQITVYYTNTQNAQAAIQSQAVTLNNASGVWRSTALIQSSALNATVGAVLSVTENNGDVYSLNFWGIAKAATLTLSPTGGAAVTYASLTLPAAAVSYSVMLESDGEWVAAFVNGQLVGNLMLRRNQATATSLQTTVSLTASGNASAMATISQVHTKVCQPFLMAGTDKGDYVLPGTATTYPVGGLHARYFNDADLGGSAGNPNRLGVIQSPPRMIAYSGSGTPPEYANQQDGNLNGTTAAAIAAINGQSNASGAAGSNWSVLWFGSVYLKLSAGNYSFSVVLPAHASNQAVRVWIGKTQFGAQLVDQWNFGNASGATYSFTVTASQLAGTLSAGGGTVQRDGWYPIKIAYAVDGTVATAPVFNITAAPASYTDPGGTSFTTTTLTVPGSSEGAKTFPQPVPSTMLSPLGMVDQRYQGVSHFDLMQQTAQAYAYQFTTEYMRLESGSFPGVCAPRIREGYDTDMVLSPDTDSRKEGILNYTSAEDATDFCADLIGNGAGFQNGSTGQLQGEVYDPNTLLTSMFDVEGWQDFSDASYSSLLNALLSSMLGLRLTPWQAVTADPFGRERLAQSTPLWPLPQNLWGMRYRPGDGVRLHAREISLWDTSPRQLLTVQRSFTPFGVTGTQVGWANRPRGITKSQRQLFFSATRLQRARQRQLVTLTGNFIDTIAIQANTSGPHASWVSLQPGDQVVSAILRVTNNPINLTFHVLVNLVNVTTTLLGAGTNFQTVPAMIDITPVAVPDSNNRISAYIKNTGASISLFSFQLQVQVLR